MIHKKKNNNKNNNNQGVFLELLVLAKNSLQKDTFSEDAIKNLKISVYTVSGIIFLVRTSEKDPSLFFFSLILSNDIMFNMT